MRRVKGPDTSPELTVRRLIWSLGARYRLHRTDLPGKPDIVLAGRRLAALRPRLLLARPRLRPRGASPQGQPRLLDRPRSRATAPATHAARAALEAAGWRVETVWECELKDMTTLEARAKGWL